MYDACVPMYDYSSYAFCSMDCSRRRCDVKAVVKMARAFHEADYYVTDAAQLENVIQEVQSISSINWNNYNDYCQ